MSTGRQLAMLAIIPAALLSVGCRTTNPMVHEHTSVPATAWWYDVEFQPASVSINGIPVERFDSGWALASRLDVEELARQIPGAGLAGYKDSGFSFSLRSDLDQDGTDEEVFVGVFKTETGAIGRFLAITQAGQVVEHFEHAGSAGFSALLATPGEVRWYKCMECGEFESLKWAGTAYILE